MNRLVDLINDTDWYACFFTIYTWFVK
jgi:hypothetical protein